MDWVFELPYQRLPHPSYNGAAVPAMDMIQHSVNIMRGCFGGCTFCSITEHEGRIIQSRSEASIIREVERIRDTSPAFTGAPVKAGLVSRIRSTSRMMEASERLWMMRPSCSVMEQKVQPPKQPRMIFTECWIMSIAGTAAPL